MLQVERIPHPPSPPFTFLQAVGIVDGVAPADVGFSASANSNKAVREEAFPGKLIDKGGMIAKGELKIGRLNNETGGYSNFVHLPCFRVPSRWWKGLPDPEASDFNREKFEKEVPRHSPPSLSLHLY